MARLWAVFRALCSLNPPFCVDFKLNRGPALGGDVKALAEFANFVAKPAEGYCDAALRCASTGFVLLGGPPFDFGFGSHACGVEALAPREQREASRVGIPPLCWLYYRRYGGFLK